MWQAGLPHTVVRKSTEHEFPLKVTGTIQSDLSESSCTVGQKGCFNGKSRRSALSVNTLGFYAFGQAGHAFVSMQA
jgi:hypothetical protein